MSMKYGFNSITWVDHIDYPNSSFRDHGPCVIFEHGVIRFSQIEPTCFSRRQGPSDINPGGTICYSDEVGELHRTDGPAVILADGSKEYWVHGSTVPASEFFLKYGVL